MAASLPYALPLYGPNSYIAMLCCVMLRRCAGVVLQEHWEKEMPDLQLEWDVPFRCVVCGVCSIKKHLHTQLFN